MKLIEDMEIIKLDYLYKNTPIPSIRNYKPLLIGKIELVIKKWGEKHIFTIRRWKTILENILENYGLNNLNCPPKIKELSPPVNELFNLLNILKFRTVQKWVSKEIKKVIQLTNSASKRLTSILKEKT